jgi:hypothetical protein
MGKGREFWLVENNLCIQAFTEKPEMHPNWTLPVTHVREVVEGEPDHAAALADALEEFITAGDNSVTTDDDWAAMLRFGKAVDAARSAIADYRASQKGGNHD